MSDPEPVAAPPSGQDMAVMRVGGEDVATVRAGGEDVAAVGAGGEELIAPRAVLAETARIVRDRPGGRRLPRDIDRIVAEHAPLLLRALAGSPGLRARVRKALDGRRLPASTAGPALLLLHPDPGVAAAAARLLDPEPSPLDVRAARRIDRLKRDKADLQGRLKTVTGRLEYARQDHEAAVARAAEAQAAADDACRQAEALRDQLTLARRRLYDPRAAATALLRTLERPPAVEGAEAPAGGLLTAAARAAQIAPADLATALRAIVEPPTAGRLQSVTELDLRVTPLGGDTEIGGSCVLVEAGGTRLLVDAGLRPGERSRPPRDLRRALDGPLHAVIVTHAHNDHAGYIPALAAARPGLRILATCETAQLMPVMWSDSARIMAQQRADSRRFGDEWLPLFGVADVEAAVDRCQEIPYGSPRRVGDLTVELFPAGHILGAAGVVIAAGPRRVVISGDISGFRQESVDGYRIPEPAKAADLLVLESTCCGETHGGRDSRVSDLVRAVEEVWDGGGRVLIPAFALGRAQELALIMRRHLPHVPVRIDGMAVDVARAFESAVPGLEIFRDTVARADRVMDLDAFRRGVIISTSGMLTGGPAVRWASRILPEPQSALFISGYQDEESPGRRLLRLADEGSGEFALTDRGTVPVRARVEVMRLSAHADRRGLLDIADEIAPRELMLVHGIASRQREFHTVLKARHQTPTPTTPWP